MIRRAKHFQKVRRAVFRGVCCILATTALSSAALATTCPSAVVTWANGPNTCSATLTAGDSTLINPYVVAIDTGDSGNHGSKVYRCDSTGNWIDNWTVTAGEPAPEAQCENNAQALLKVVGTEVEDISASMPYTDVDTCSALTCNSGTVTQGCITDYRDDSTDTTVQHRAYNCSLGDDLSSPPPGCAAQNVSWIVNGNVCTGNVTAMTDGATLPVTDAGTPTTGAANFTCTSGVVSVVPGGSCIDPVEDQCFPTSTVWTVGTSTCVADVPGVEDNAVITVNDNTPAALGSATMTCNNGIWTRSGETCTAPVPPVCPPILPPPPPAEVLTGGCYVDTWDFDAVTAGSCESNLCSGTNVIHFSVGSHLSGDAEFYYFGNNNRYVVTWTGACTGSGNNMSQCTAILPNGVHTATATVLDTDRLETHVFTVTASKAIAYRNDPTQCPPPP